MSSTVDQRIVEMRFDNKNFENNVSTTMSTLEKFKQKLRLDGASKGLEDVNTAAKKVDMSGLGKSVETVQAKFSALQVMGVTALANITNSVVNAGKRMVSALTIEPVKDGFQEYEMTLNAVQTTMAATGKTSEEVEKQLKSLDEYADKTVYSTADMLNNLPKFTNAGVALEDATKAMIGIANATALAGGDAGKASIAFYNLGQAIGTGYLTRMDYNSINNAGIATMEWKNQMVEAAIAQGTLTQVGEDAYQAGSKTLTLQQLFIDGLQEQWATTDVMMEVFGAYGDETTEIGKKSYAAAQDIKTYTQMMESLKATAGTGWKDTWQAVFGNLEEAKVFWTGLTNFISNIITKMADFRNKILKSAFGTSITKMFKNISKSIETVSKPVKSMVSVASKATGVIDKVTGSLEDLSDIVNKVIRGNFGNGKERVEALTKAGYNYYRVQNKVNETLGNSFRFTDEQIAAQDKLLGAQQKTTQAKKDDVDTTAELTDADKKLIAEFAALSDAELRAKGFTEEQIEAFRELRKMADKLGLPLNELINNLDKINGRWLIMKSFKNIGDSLVKTFEAIGEAWAEIFPPESTGQKIFNIIAAFHKLSTGLVMSDETADNLKRTFKGLFAALDIILTIVSAPLKIAFKLLTKILSMFDMNILDATAKLGDMVVAFRNFLFDNQLVNKVIEKTAYYLVRLVEKFREWIGVIKELPIVQKFVNKLKNAFGYMKTEGMQKLVEYLSLAAHKVVALIREFKNSPVIISIIDKIKNALLAAKDIGSNIISGLIKGIKGGHKSVGEAIISLGRSILDWIRGVLGIHSPSTEFLEIGKNVILGFVNGIKSGVSWVVTALSDVVSTCVNFIRKIDLRPLLAIGAAAGVIVLIKKIGDALSVLAGPIEGVSDVLESFSGVLDGLNKRLKASAWKVKSEALKNLAISIAILVAAVYVLTKLKTGAVWASIGAIAALAAIIVTMSILIGKFGPKEALKFGSFALGILAIAASMTIVASALKKIAGLSLGQAAIAVGSMILIIGALTTMMVLYGKFVKGKAAQNIDKAGVMLLKMSLVLMLMTFTIKQISKLEPGALVKGIVCISRFGAFLVVLMAATQLVGKNANRIGSTLLKISLAMIVLVGVVKLISKLTPGEMIKGLVFIGALGSFFAALMLATNLIGPNVGKIGSTFLALSASMMIIALTVKFVAGLSVGELVKGLVFVSALGSFFAALMLATNMIGPNVGKIGLTMLALSVSIGILAAVMMMISMLDVGAIAKGLVAIGGMGLIVAQMVKATREAQDCKGNLIVMTVAIGIMAAAIALLSLIKWTGLAKATIALGSLMGMFALMTKMAGTVDKGMGVMIVLTVAIGVLAGALYLIAQLPIKKALGSAAALSLLMGTLAVSLKIISGMNASIKDVIIGVVGLLVLAAPLRAFASILSKMNEVQNATTNAIALSILAGVLSLALIPLSLVGIMIGASGGAALLGVVGLLALVLPLQEFVDILITMEGIQNAEKNVNLITKLITTLTVMLVAISLVAPLVLIGTAAIAAMTVLIVGLGALVVGIGALFEKFPMLEGFINKGIPILQKLASGLGIVIGSFVSGVLTSATAGLPQVGANLSLFMANATPFIMGAQSIDAKMLEGVKALAQTILILTAADILEGLTSWFTGGSSLADFGAEIAAFGPHLKKFADSVAGIDATAVQGAATAAKTLAEMADTVPNEGGLAGWFAGENSLAAFGEEIVGFGKNLKAYAQAVAGIDGAAVTASASAAKSLAEMADTIPNEGGVVGWFAGENSLAAFGSQFVSFGRSLKQYSIEVAGIDGEAVTASTTAAKALSDLANTIPNEGGVAAWFGGDNSIAAFGSRIVMFGTFFAAYAKSMSSVDIGVVEATSAAAQSIVKLANSLPEDKFFKNETTIDEFGGQLSKFGGHFAKYYKKISGINPEQLRGTVTELKRLVSLGKSMSGLDTSGMSGFGAALAKLGNTGITKFINAFKNATPKVRAAVNNMINTLIQGVNSKSTAMSNAFVKVVNNVVKSLRSRQSVFKGLGTNFMTSLSNGVKSKISSVTNGMSYITVKMASKLKEGRKEFYDAGGYLVKGFAAGIKENTWRAEAKARATALAALQAAKDALRIESPSKVARDEVGRYFVQGIAEGISSDMSAEEKAAQKAQNIVSAFQTEFDKLDTKVQTAELEYQVWMDEKGKDASETDKQAAETKYLTEKYKAQKERVALAEGEYQETLKHLGASAKETQEAYNKFLQERIALNDLTESLINDAFQSEADKIDSRANTRNLEYELWSKTEGLNKTETEQRAKEMELLSSKYSDQAAKVALAEQKYKKTLESFGATAEETKEAYDVLLKEQISLADLGTEIEDLKNKALTNTPKTFDAYAKYLKENLEAMVQEGLTLEEMQKRASSATGWDYTKVAGYGDLAAETESTAKSIGEQYVATVGAGVKGAESQLISNAYNLMTNCTDNIKAFESEWGKCGTQLVQGFIKGINADVTLAAQAAADMAIAAYKAAIEALDINSPSKLFFEIGKFADLGFAKGLSSYAGSAVDASVDVAEGALGGLKSMVARMTDSINEEIESQPSISPVLDLSNIQNGVSNLQGWFAQRSATLAASASLAVNSRTNMQDLIGEMQKLNDERDSEIVGAISELREDFGSLIDAIGNLSISMDGDTVVGKLAGRIDTALGKIANHKGRGN